MGEFIGGDADIFLEDSLFKIAHCEIKANCLIYDLYFKDSIRTDLINVVKGEFKSIINKDYDKDKDLNDEILWNLREVYQILKNSRLLEDELKIINNFKWINIIEGKLGV